MRVRVQATATAVGVLLGLQIAAAGAASADENPVLVADTRNVTLTAKDDGGATAAVTIENQAEEPIDVWAEVGSVADKDCTITSPAEDKATEVDGHRQQKVTITFAEACDPFAKTGRTSLSTPAQQLSTCTPTRPRHRTRTGSRSS